MNLVGGTDGCQRICHSRLSGIPACNEADSGQAGMTCMPRGRSEHVEADSGQAGMTCVPQGRSEHVEADSGRAGMTCMPRGRWEYNEADSGQAGMTRKKWGNSNWRVFLDTIPIDMLTSRHGGRRGIRRLSARYLPHRLRMAVHHLRRGSPSMSRAGPG